MIKAVVFDMFETIVTLFNSSLYKGGQPCGKKEEFDQASVPMDVLKAVQ